jgi:hypothetical protein
MEYFFKVKKRIFRAFVEKRPYGFFITIGGKTFTKCMELSISVSLMNNQNGSLDAASEHNVRGFNSSFPPTGILMQVKSEPECGYNSFLENGETPDMIKAGLQLCADIVPGLKLFRLNDDSNIECGESKGSSPPRSLGKPFSLPQYSIAIYGKTWYERHFGAKLENERKYIAYRNSVEILSKHIPDTMTFEEFSRQNVLSQEQVEILQGPFEKARTWYDFFKAVPRKQSCIAFYNWLPFFINNILDGEFNNNGWIINIDSMEKVDMTIVSPETISGGQRKKRTLRKKKYTVKFNSSNTNGLRLEI